MVVLLVWCCKRLVRRLVRGLVRRLRGLGGGKGWCYEPVSQDKRDTSYYVSSR